jgi:hypothetical protein
MLWIQYFKHDVFMYTLFLAVLENIKYQYVIGLPKQITCKWFAAKYEVVCTNFIYI